MRTRTIFNFLFIHSYISNQKYQARKISQFAFIILLFFTSSSVVAQQWKATGALAASNVNWYLTGATSVGNDVFAVNATQAMVYSTDLGVSWSAPAATKLKGTYWYILGIENRLYASNKINAYDTELHYSTDKGVTWKPDSVGLPLSIAKTGKSAMNLKYMENGYMLAHNNLVAFYKKVEETKWNPTTIDHTIVDVAATRDKWLAVGPGKILQSTNNGGTWTQLNTTGLPANFQGNKICTNGKRIYISNAPKDGAQDIYYSDDGGSSWTLTNSAGKFTHANPWVQNLYAVEDYVFAAIMPIGFTKPPPYLYSKMQQPDFLVGDFSVYTGLTTSNLPFFFHVKNKLFTMMGDLYSSEPGFKGDSNPSTGIDFAELENKSIFVYPNPASQTIKIQAGNQELSKIEIFSLTGKKVLERTIQQIDAIDVSSWSNGVYVVKTTSTNGSVYQTKLIKK